MPNNLRNENHSARQKMTRHKRIVVKVGTTSLTYPNGQLHLQRIERLCLVLSDLCNRGKEMVLVTSGATAVGADRLGMAERPRDILGKQAAAAVGQAVLMQIYQQFFTPYNRHIAQFLLTKGVVDNAVYNQNARNTFARLLAMRVIPVVNQNDSIATDEFEFGEFSENDTLSAYVAILSQADCLINLSDRDGLYDADPKDNPQAALFHEIFEITPALEAAAGGSSTKLGTGGMATKLSAAKLALAHGIDMAIAHGEDPAVLWRLLDGERVGTLFSAGGCCP